MQSFPHSDEYNHFIAELRAMREEAGLTQSELAARLKVDRTVVTKGETGLRRIDVVELRAWLGAMNLTLLPFVKRLEERLARNARPVARKRSR